MSKNYNWQGGSGWIDLDAGGGMYFLTPNLCGLFPIPTTSSPLHQHQLAVPQFNAVLTLTTHREPVSDSMVQGISLTSLPSLQTQSQGPGHLHCCLTRLQMQGFL